MWYYLILSHTSSEILKLSGTVCEGGSIMGSLLPTIKLSSSEIKSSSTASKLTLGDSTPNTTSSLKLVHEFKVPSFLRVPLVGKSSSSDSWIISPDVSCSRSLRRSSSSSVSASPSSEWLPRSGNVDRMSVLAGLDGEGVFGLDCWEDVRDAPETEILGLS